MTHSLKRRVPFNLLVALVLTAALVLPDHIMSAISDANRAYYPPHVLALLLAFCLLVSLAAQDRLIAGFLIVLGCFEVIHFSYMAYFGGVVDAGNILRGIEESRDVVLGGLGVAGFLLYAPFIVIVPYAAAWRLLAPLLPARLVVPWLWCALIALGAIIPFRIVQAGNAVRYLPQDIFPSVVNSYLTFSVLLFHDIPALLYPGNRPGAHYLPVTVSRVSTPGRITVVIVMNESLTSDRMSLYGYKRNTTPRLAELRDDPNFVYRKGLSAGVDTRSTFYSFWNGVRDPRNERALADQQTNLFRLARNNGFHTVFLSAQRSNLLRGVGTQYLDRLVTVETVSPLFGLHRDLMFEELLRGEALQERNLIVLHLRAAHGPYAQNYALNPDLAIFPERGRGYGEYQANTYDNAVRYNDLVMRRLIEYFRGAVDGPLYVFLTSDHGQLLGENGSRRFGHGMLLPEVARVPIMLYAENANPAIVGALRAMPRPTHFELTTLITRLLGYEIHDPNDRSGVYYINGTGYFGRDGYISVTRGESASAAAQFQIHRDAG
jgi:glucan phosphoethanolaminetransferase (alkaline phosphatase superfamily)